jgi:hypothetical protein
MEPTAIESDFQREAAPLDRTRKISNSKEEFVIASSCEALHAGATGQLAALAVIEINVDRGK